MDGFGGIIKIQGTRHKVQGTGLNFGIAEIIQALRNSGLEPCFLSLVPSPFAFEKTFHQFGAFFFQYAFGNFCFGVKGPVRIGNAFMAVLFIIGAPDDLADLAPVKGPGAHEAGFYGYVYGCIR